MDAVVEAALGDLGDVGDEVDHVRAHRGPAVDDQEHVAVGLVGELPGRPPTSVGADRVDAVIGEELFAATQQRGHLRDGTGDPLDVHTAADPAHVRQVGDPAQGAAAEVQDVELHLFRRVGERQRGDQ